MQKSSSPTQDRAQNAADQIINSFRERLVHERRAAQSERYPSVCIMGDRAFLEFLQALRIHFGDVLTTNDEAYQSGIHFEGVTIHWSRAMPTGIIFGGPPPY